VSTQTDVRPETQDTETGPDMFHYVDKDKMVESAVMGNWVIAICGYKFPVTKAPKPDSPVCPECKEIYEQLQP
jgi:rubrerythrin